MKKIKPLITISVISALAACSNPTPSKIDQAEVSLDKNLATLEATLPLDIEPVVDKDGLYQPYSYSNIQNSLAARFEFQRLVDKELALPFFEIPYSATLYNTMGISFEVIENTSPYNKIGSYCIDQKAVSMKRFNLGAGDSSREELVVNEQLEKCIQEAMEQPASYALLQILDNANNFRAFKNHKLVKPLIQQIKQDGKLTVRQYMRIVYALDQAVSVSKKENDDRNAKTIIENW